MNEYTHAISDVRKGYIIGQAPPEKIYEIPFSRTRLYKWLETIGLTKQDVLALFNFDALVPAFLGKEGKKHIVPNPIEIQQYAPILLEKINNSQSSVILAVGKESIQAILALDNVNLTDVIGKKFVVKPFGLGERSITIIPLPHPSGLSTWIYKNENKNLLEQGLKIVKQLVQYK